MPRTSVDLADATGKAIDKLAYRQVKRVTGDRDTSVVLVRPPSTPTPV